MNRNRIFSRREIEARIAGGDTIIISEGRVLRLNGWLDKHPGGRLAVLHMVGRDATDEINVYHSTQTLKTMNKYRIGRIAIDEPWVNYEPPIRGGLFRPITTHDSSSEDEDARSELSSSSLDYSSATSVEDLTPSRPTSDIYRRRSTVARPAASLISDSDTSDSLLVLDDKTEEEASIGSSNGPHHTPTSYTTSIEQQEIDRDLEHYPSLDQSTQQNITLKYQQLHQRIKDEGLYECRYREYGKEFLRYSLFFTLFIVTLRSEWYMTSAVFLGLFWHQIMFTAHDAGHMGITHKFVPDTLIGMFIADFCCGLSIGWWKSSHNVHHLVPNHPKHDPDIQNVPLFATSPSFFHSLHSSYYDFTFLWDRVANLAVPYQHYTYYPIMCIARFNLYLLSWLHLLSPRSTNLGAASWTRPTEIAFMLCYWLLFGHALLLRSLPTWPLRIAFVLVSHVVTMPLHVQITLSHFAMSTADLGPAESFAQKQLRTTMDVACPAWMDFVHGGLQFQAVHHLFPRVPRHNLRRVQALVREFGDETGIEYKVLGFVDGNREVLGRLGEVARQVEMLVDCQRYMAETGESGLH